MTIDTTSSTLSIDLIERMLDQVTSGLVAVDAGGTIIMMNSEARAILGSTGPLLGRTLTSSSECSAECEALGKVISSCLHEPRVLRRQSVTIESDGESRVLGYNLAPLLDNGRVEGAVLVFTDLTAVKERERRQSEDERFAQVGRVASWMAHEVKNPLATIQMYAQLASKGLDPTQQEAVRVIREQVVLAQSRISELLRSLTPQMDEKRKLAVTDMGPVLAGHIEKESRGLPHVTFATDVDAGDHHVPLAPPDVLSLVSNLIANAAEALEGPGTVTVTLASTHLHTRLTVSDTGPGFPDGARQRLIQPFFTTKKRGTGLGLWVVRRICDSVGGRLLLENTDEGGASVTLELPHLSTRDLAEKTILVVEDDATVRRLLRRQLEEFRAVVHEADGAIPALMLLESIEVDVLVSDVNMPKGGGHVLVQRLPTHVPILLISGILESDMERDLTLRPGVAFLMKPFSAEDFGLALAYLLWERDASSQGEQ